MNNIIANILRFLLLLIAQIAICQHINLFGYMSPALFLLALFLLPLELPLSLQYLIGFATGFVSQCFVNRRFPGFMLAAAAALLITALVQMLKVWAADTGSPVMIGTVLLQTLWSLPPAALAYFPPARWIE